MTRDRLRGRDIDRNIDRMVRERDRRGPVEARDDSLFGRLKAGAQTVAEKAGPVAGKIQAHAAQVSKNMESSGGFAMPSPPSFSMPSFGFDPPAAPREPRSRGKRGGGSRTTIWTGGQTITISQGGGGKKKGKRKKGDEGGGKPPWDPSVPDAFKHLL